MIKLLRNIRHKLLSENKFSKYLIYAIGEIILVMVGILLALQVSNWNQQHSSQNKEKLLLSELHSEFVANDQQLDKIIREHQIALNACDTLISMFPINIELKRLDSIPVTLLWDLKQRWTFNPSQGIIKSLVNTSSFELISDQELRKLLISWNDVLTDYQESEMAAVQHVIEILNPFLNNHFHYINGIYDSRSDISILGSIEFENLIWQRKEYLTSILETNKELSTIQIIIHRIIELSKQ